MNKTEDERSDGAEELGEVGFGLRVHADDDDQRNEAVVSDDLGLLHSPGAPLLQILGHRFLLRRGLFATGLALGLQGNLRRH